VSKTYSFSTGTRELAPLLLDLSPLGLLRLELRKLVAGLPLLAPGPVLSHLASSVW
jgi:hypothetical protein